MTAKRYIIFLFLFYAILAKGQTDPSTLTKLGDIAPDFTFEIEKNQIKNLKDYRGKFIMINLFATWCPPCMEELPRVQKEIWDKYKNHPKFALFVFGREQGWEVLEPFKNKHQYTFPILPDPKREIFNKYAKQSIPRNIILDEQGRIIYQSIGYTSEDFAELLSLLEKKLH